uniref:Uncharacterized protein n=1 Tax=Rhizophora mucronata TaxID=61149 RepID=A0A2P2PX35_RHIMU
MQKGIASGEKKSNKIQSR